MLDECYQAKPGDVFEVTYEYTRDQEDGDETVTGDRFVVIESISVLTGCMNCTVKNLRTGKVLKGWYIWGNGYPYFNFIEVPTDAEIANAPAFPPVEALEQFLP